MVEMGIGLLLGCMRSKARSVTDEIGILGKCFEELVALFFVVFRTWIIDDAKYRRVLRLKYPILWRSLVPSATYS